MDRGTQLTHLPILVEMEGSAIGMAWLAITDRIPGPEKWKRRSGDLQSVYVIAEHRYAGLGSLLVSKVIRVAEEEDLAYDRRHGFVGEGDLLIRYMET